jgi:glutathione peroxidase
MKHLLLTTAFLLTFPFFASAEAKKSVRGGSFYSLHAESIDGKAVNFSEFAGKVVVVVNTASKCGFTPQYKDLQQLYLNYKDKGVVVLGFPSNDFLHQEPGTNEEVKQFCQVRYGVEFPLFDKQPVSGEQKQPVYRYLTEESGEYSGEIDWNFEKFLIDKHGEVRARFGSFVNPLNDRVTKKIDELLGES